MQLRTLGAAWVRIWHPFLFQPAAISATFMNFVSLSGDLSLTASKQLCLMNGKASLLVASGLTGTASGCMKGDKFRLSGITIGQRPA